MWEEEEEEREVGEEGRKGDEMKIVGQQLQRNRTIEIQWVHIYKHMER